MRRVRAGRPRKLSQRRVNKGVRVGKAKVAFFDRLHVLEMSEKDFEITNAASERKTSLLWAKSATAAGKKGGVTAAGQKRLSELMKATWAARRKAVRKK
jgi:hypothetical protein